MLVATFMTLAQANPSVHATSGVTTSEPVTAISSGLFFLLFLLIVIVGSVSIIKCGVQMALRRVAVILTIVLTLGLSFYAITEPGLAWHQRAAALVVALGSAVVAHLLMRGNRQTTPPVTDS